jgi:protein tyrosine phosphatase (PTP) superfamily phosphohydrolase (DUF442 family)
MDAQSTFQVFDWLWTSGQLSERDIDELPGLGINAVVNLALPSSSNALPGEAELVTGKGICYFQIPVVWEKPELDQLSLFFDLLDSLKGKKVWVHCAMNMRVSVFIYLYRKLRLNEDETSASYPMRQVWQPNDIWQLFIYSAEMKVKR